MSESLPSDAPRPTADARPAAAREWEVLFDALPMALVVLDATGRIRRCNMRAVLLTGAEDDGMLLGRCFWDAVLHVGPPGADDVLWRALEDRRPARARVRGRAPGRILDVSAAPHPEGGALFTFDDVTPHHALAERHRSVVETTTEAILITDPQRRVAFANAAAAAMFGLTAEELAGTAVADLVAPEHREAVAQREAAAMAGEPQRYETTIVRRDGERRVTQVSNAPLRELGEVTGVIASLRDVTDERRARDAVAQSEARYRNLFETASDAIYTLDVRADFTSVNHAACEILGRPREELLGRSLIPFVDPSEIEAATDHFRAARAGLPNRYLCHFFTASGERRLASVTNTPIHRDGHVVGVLGIARDITAERAREEALHRSEQRYARLVEFAWDAIFTFDELGRFTSANVALERAVGVTRAQLQGRHCAEMVIESEREAMRAMMEQALDGERQRCEVHYAHADGSVRTGSLTVTPIVEEGRVTGALGVVRDVTEERRLAQQLHRREKLAAVGQLVSGVAHELNNPLAGIIAFSQLLLASAPATPEQLESAATIHKEAKRAAKIIANLLLFARQRPPERVPTDLNAVLTDSLELRRYSLRTGGITVTTELDDSIPPLSADPAQLQQVFLNLLVNAEQAVQGQPGPKRITLRTSRNGERLVASISDNGEGVSTDFVDQIFNPFFTTKAVGEGTGLGLSISDGIVREHGGQIRVDSRPGEGATFHVELPLAAASPNGRSDAAAAVPASAT